MKKERTTLPLASLELNTGQIEWLPRNPRQWTADDVNKTAKSIAEDEDFLEDRPILVVPNGKKFVVFAGNLRSEGAKKQKLKDAPCVVYYPETEADQEAVIRRAAKDNGSFGQFDWDILANEWDALPLQDWGIPAWPDEDNAQAAGAGEKNVEEDDFDEEKDHIAVRCKKGDIWQLGEHRLMCGDSIDSDDVKKLMGEIKAELLFTSPPYSDMRTYNGDKDLSVSNLAQFIRTYKQYAEYQCVNLGLQVRDGGIVRYWDEYIEIAEASGYKLLAWNVWDKQTCGAINNQTHFIVPLRHEWIFVFGTKYKDINKTWAKSPDSIKEGLIIKRVRDNDGGFHETSTGDHSNPLKKMESVTPVWCEHGEIRSEHPAVFPVALAAEYVKAFTKLNDIVIEPFCGSGSTIIACEQLGRKCRAMELDPHYCDVILARWEKATGRNAEKVS